jgi:hypothetical protein
MLKVGFKLELTAPAHIIVRQTLIKLTTVTVIVLVTVLVIVLLLTAFLLTAFLQIVIALAPVLVTVLSAPALAGNIEI